MRLGMFSKNRRKIRKGIQRTKLLGTDKSPAQMVGSPVGTAFHPFRAPVVKKRRRKRFLLGRRNKGGAMDYSAHWKPEYVEPEEPHIDYPNDSLVNIGTGDDMQDIIPWVDSEGGKGSAGGEVAPLGVGGGLGKGLLVPRAKGIL